MTPRSLPLAAAATLLATGLAVAPALTSPASAAPTHGDQRVCAAAPVGYAACHARVRTLITPDGKARPDATSGPTGYSATQLRTAYGLTSLSGSTTVAVVDAYANPNVLSDLTAYRSAMKISAPLSFTELGQTGGPRSAGADVGWGQEEMLDLEMVSAICPTCPIVYVGANTANFSDLGPAVNTAAAHAQVVSNSYGGGEYSGEKSVQDSYYTHPGIAITVSSGDNGYGVQIPAAFNTVTAVGGTSLTLNADGTRKNETVWSGAGSGCSAVIAKPAWQHDGNCARRTVADVSADADPNTGVSVYDSWGSSGGLNWYVFGGTSVAAPIIAGMYGLSGNTGTTTGTTAQTIPASLSYANSGALFDVTSGTNSRHCRAGYLCSAAVGYDGPTGNGTPKGLLTPF